MIANTAKGFLQHIMAEPEDNTPRLIFADWLEEHGDSARAELIRVQVERASLPGWDGRHARLALREGALLKKHGRKWKAQLPVIKGVKWGDFRRGFVATATFASFTVLRENASACWAAAPIEAITIRWPRPDEDCESMPPIAGLRELYTNTSMVSYDQIMLLAEAPLLSTLRVLTIRDGALGPEGLRLLGTSPHLAGLKALRLPCNFIGNGIAGLRRAASLTSLEELDLSEQEGYGSYGEDPVLDRVGIEALAKWPGLARIRSLNLSGNRVGRHGLRALLRSRRATGLKELVLRNSDLTGPALQEFETAQPGLQLDVLDLGDNLLEGPGAANLARARCLDELKVLEIPGCEIPSSTARRMAKAPFLASLRRLNANYNTIGPEGLEALLDAKPTHLHTLLLVANDLEDKGVAQLAESPGSDTLQALHLGGNGLTDKAARALAKSDHLQGLLILRLGDNRINKRAADALRRSALGKRLAVLEMGNKVYDTHNPY
jgi:uncharacterized protein (TIGR02996 family)